MSEKIVDKYFEVYVNEFFEQLLEDVYTDQKQFAWFKDSYSPENMDEIFVARQFLIKKRSKEFIESLAEHDHLRAINLEIDISALNAFSEKKDELGNSVFEILEDQIQGIPPYIAPLTSKYQFYLICGVEKTISYMEIYRLFEKNINFEQDSD